MILVSLSTFLSLAVLNRRAIEMKWQRIKSLCTYVCDCLCLFVSVCVCVCTWLWMSAYVSMSVCAWLCVCGYVSMCVCVYLCVHVCICICVRMPACVYVYVSVCVCRYVCVSLSLCMHSCTPWLSGNKNLSSVHQFLSGLTASTSDHVVWEWGICITRKISEDRPVRRCFYFIPAFLLLPVMGCGHSGSFYDL